MKAFYWQVILTAIATAGYLFYANFELLAHWVLLLFFSLLFSMWLLSFIYNRKSFYQVIYLTELIIFFTKEMFKATFQVAWEVLSPKTHIESGMIALPLEVKTNLEITILASLISLTPGTLSIEISEDKSFLFVHAMYIPFGDVDKLKAEIKDGFERRILRVFN
jgi:multicomponent Na+:H+ antiporter subunit E